MKLTLLFGLLAFTAQAICKYTNWVDAYAYIPRDSFWWSSTGTIVIVCAFCVVGALINSMMPKRKKS